MINGGRKHDQLEIARHPTMKIRRVPRSFLGMFVHIHRHIAP